MTEGSPTPKLGCDKCGQKFSLLENMRRHKREKHFDFQVNTDFEEGSRIVYTFNCEQCDGTFKRKDHLSRHVKNAHNEKQLNCLHCNQKFARQDNLKRHMKKKHEQKSE